MIKSKEKLLHSINTLERIVDAYEKEVQAIETHWKDKKKMEFYQKHIVVQIDFNRTLRSNLNAINFQFNEILSKLESLK